jgi:predicted acetyltransferase
MNQEFFLVEPSVEYKESFLSLVMDYLRQKEDTYTNLYKPAMANFDKYVKKLLEHARGKNLPNGEVPYTTYWLTNTHKKVYGNVRIRHQSLPVYGNIGYDIRPSFRGMGYGTILLKLTLEKAREFGMSRLKIACDQRNKASIRVIEKNGGEFLERVYDRKTRLFVNRYFIDL